jgi:hypothetical protein
MSQINLDKIKKQAPKPKSYFILQSLAIIFGLVIFLFLTVFSVATLYRVFVDIFIFPRLFGPGFWLTLTIGLALIFSLIILAINLYRIKDWKFGRSWLAVFLVAILVVAGGSFAWLLSENQVEKEEEIPTHRVQNIFGRFNPGPDQNAKVFRGRVEKLDLPARKITIANPDEKLDLEIPPEAANGFPLKEKQHVTVLYKQENAKNILVEFKPPMPGRGNPQ